MCVSQIGLEAKMKSTENTVEHVEVTEEPDDDQPIEDEVLPIISV
jgi:hypothetical protein